MAVLTWWVAAWQMHKHKVDLVSAQNKDKSNRPAQCMKENREIQDFGSGEVWVSVMY